MTFLPDNYKTPDNSDYMKFKKGENTFRVLGAAIVGSEYWNRDKKPIRSRVAFESVPIDIQIDENGNPTAIKHFWAFPVWNYEAEKVQILEITQSSVQGAIKAIVDNKKWGDPKGFDFTVTRTGDGLETEYAVMPNPHTELDGKIEAAYRAKRINLDALYEGKNPFGDEKE